MDINTATPPAALVPEDWRECTQCGLISSLPAMRPELVADCPRCQHTLWRMRRFPFEFPLACAVAGALFFSFAVIAPFLEVSSFGHFQLARIETGPYVLASQGFDLVALLVFSVTILVPGAQLAIMLVTLLGLETRWVPTGLLKDIFRWYEPLRPWAMTDVYLLGFLVAYTRLIVIASVHLDTALYSLIGLMISMAAAHASLDPEAVWRALNHEAPCPRPLNMRAVETSSLIGCGCCGLVNEALPGERCRRCDKVLRPRKTNSIARSWALLITAAILYLPANLYPVMTLTNLTSGSRAYTIMGGIFELVERGLWPLAVLVFFASIMIPLTKILILGYMLINTQFRSEEHLLGRTISFRIIDFIGRWSMIDVFMISILVALVRFGPLANVVAEFGAACFAAVVVLTMFAVSCFDPRLMWDAIAEHEAERRRAASAHLAAIRA